MKSEPKAWLPGVVLLYSLLTEHDMVLSSMTSEQFFSDISSNMCNLTVECHEEAVQEDIEG